MSDADATLNAECGEECCDHAYDKLEYSLERFFVFCVTHGVRSLKLLLSCCHLLHSGRLRDAFGFCQPFLFLLQRYNIPKNQSYVSIRFLRFEDILSNFLQNYLIIHETHIFRSPNRNCCASPLNHGCSNRQGETKKPHLGAQVSPCWHLSTSCFFAIPRASGAPLHHAFARNASSLQHIPAVGLFRLQNLPKVHLSLACFTQSSSTASA